MPCSDKGQGERGFWFIHDWKRAAHQCGVGFVAERTTRIEGPSSLGPTCRSYILVFLFSSVAALACQVVVTDDTSTKPLVRLSILVFCS